MKLIRRIILALALFAGLSPAFAQVPAAVPALPDTERRTSYSITASTCACAVNMALYGDSTDYQSWVEVFINGVRYDYNDASHGWTITSPSGSLSNLARPITNAVLTFNSAQTGTVQIVGARRPRQTTQLSEGGVSARALNQRLTDTTATLREIWDKTNDVTGRALLSQPGSALGLLPPPSSCASRFLGFDVTGLNPTCTPLVNIGALAVPNPSTINGLTYWTAANGTSVGSTNSLNNGIVQTGAAGVPFVSTTLPTLVGIDDAPLKIRSNDLTKSSGLSVGRTSAEGYFAAIGHAGDYTPNSLVGDTVVRGNTNLLLSGGGASATVGVVIDSANTMRLPNTLTLAPPVGFNLGLSETQTLSGASPPAQTGTFLGYAANRISVNNNSSYAQSLFGLHVELDSTAAGSSPGNAAGFFHTISGAASGSATFASSSIHYVSAETNWASGTTLAPNGAPIALSVYALMGGSNTLHMYNLSGGEINIQARGGVGSTVKYKSGIQIANLSNDVLQGTDYDAALSLSNIFDGTGISPGWDAALMLSDANGQQPMAATGSIFKTKGAWTKTIVGGFDLRGNYTFTGCAFASSNFCVDGAGNLGAQKVNSVTITTPATGATLTIANNKSFTASNTMTLTATDGSTVAFGAGGTVLYGNQTITLSGAVTGSGTTAITTTFGTQATNTVLGNATAGTASPTALAVGSCDTATKALQWTTNTGFGCNSSITAAAVPASGLTGTTLASGVVTSSLTSVGTLTGGATGAGFTVALTTSTVSGNLPCANTPAYTGDVTKSSGSCATVLATAQPAVHTWALAQTFTVAPVFTDQSGSRTALGLGTAATQNTGTSGANVPLLNGANVFSANTSISASGVAADAILTINGNTGATVAPIANTGLHLVGADVDNNTFELDAFQGQNLILARTAEGTRAAKSATVATRKLLNIGGQGWDGSAYASGASIIMFAAETWSGSAHGAYIAISTNPTGSTAFAEAMRIQPSGAVAIGVTTDSGVGTMQLKKQTFASLTACSSTLEGATASITDSSTATWGATITGSSTNHVLGYCNGTNWTVAAK